MMTLKHKALLNISVLSIISCLIFSLCFVLSTTSSHKSETPVALTPIKFSAPAATTIPTVLIINTLPPPTVVLQSIPIATETPVEEIIIVTETLIWNCSGDTYNCSSFDNHQKAQDYFNACPGDPSKLDRDNDGIVCENN